MGAPVAAYEIRARLEGPKHLLSVFSAGDRVSLDYHLALGLYLLPILAGGILAAILLGRYRAWAGLAAGVLSIAAFIFLRGEVGSFAFHRLAGGSYLSLVAGLGLAAMALGRSQAGK